MSRYYSNRSSWPFEQVPWLEQRSLLYPEGFVRLIGRLWVNV